MCPSTRHHFPLLSSPTLPAVQILCSWMTVLLVCWPPLDCHIFCLLQDLLATQLRSHTGPSTCSRASQPVARRCLGRRPGSRCSQSAPSRQPPALLRCQPTPSRPQPALLPRQPAGVGLLSLLPPARSSQQVRHPANTSRRLGPASLHRRNLYIALSTCSSTSILGDSKPLLLVLLPCQREPCLFPLW